MKPIVWWSVAIALGALAVFGGLFGGVLSTPSSQVTCGEEVMTPSDVCEEKRRGSHSTYSYEEMKAKNASDPVIGGVAGIVFGGGFAVFSTVKLVQAVRARRRPVSQPWPQQGVPQSVQVPQYHQQQFPQQFQQPGPPQPYPPQPYPPQPYPPQQNQPYQPPQGFGPRGY